ncbi:hypothetical protein TWF788_000576 [Orbilia oligospora]|uniref:Uncharacterized protein n=1 Tax=Orbilia oligospora TaxID=2813651 RepID=A0A7C8KAT7_ORBOL|nr:hypothetical protein TWF788_000576 [Orbilia oligospora]
MPIHPSTPPNKNELPTISPRFSTPDHWNETGEEIEFTPWEQEIITLKPGTNIKSVIPKQPKRPRGRPPCKSKDSSKAKTPARTYKSRCKSKALDESKDLAKTNLPRKPIGKRVLLSPETLTLTRFKPVEYLDPIEKAAARSKITPAPKKLKTMKKSENPKKLENTKKPVVKKKPPLQSEMPPRRSVPIETVPDKPGRHKKWFEDIDEDLLRGTKWARQLNQNSLQRENGNPGVLSESKTRKAYNESISAKQKTVAVAKPGPPPLRQASTRKKPEQAASTDQALDCIRQQHSPQLRGTVSPQSDKQLQNETTVKVKEKAKPQSFGFESFQFEDVSEGDIERLGNPDDSAREGG